MAGMFERLDTPEELFNFKLGCALSMEHDVLESLQTLEDKAQRNELKQLFRHHQDETRQQISNIEQAFRAMGQEPDDKPAPSAEALEKEAKANIRRTDDRLVDAMILSGAAETEHHEIAVYEGLIAFAEARGAQDVAQLLRQNLEQEQHTLQEVMSANKQCVQEIAQAA
jgi:ferritin-like metal-binding protein YciE